MDEITPPIVYQMCWFFGILAIVIWLPLLCFPLWTHNYNKPIKPKLYDRIVGKLLGGGL